LAQVQNDPEKLSPLTDFAVNFVDRQRLKMIEDKVLDLVVIFESLYNTLLKLRNQCEAHCKKDQCIECTCASTCEELEEQMHEAQVNIKKAEILHKRAQGTAQLVSLCHWGNHLEVTLITLSSRIYLTMRMLRLHT